MHYHFEKLGAHNLSALVFLYKEVFGNTYSLAYVQRKFDTSYLSTGPFGHIAFFENSPVAFHGAIPVKMCYREEIELAAQYGDAMTLSAHAGKGLFTKLGRLTDEQLQEAGVKFVWGFPNQNSEYGYVNKLQWQSKERMLGFRIKLRRLSIEKISKRMGFLSRKYRKRLAAIINPLRTNTFPRGSIDKSKAVTVARSSAYYQYKSFGGSICINLSGVIFWIKILGGHLVGDVEVTDGANFQKGLAQLRALAGRLGVDQIIFQASPKTLISKSLEDIVDEVFESWMVGYKNFNSDFPLHSMKYTFGDLDTF